eukprot:COSAG02_NODE_5448_length_4314_cov_2.488019_1_plen_569_part_00
MTGLKGEAGRRTQRESAAQRGLDLGLDETNGESDTSSEKFDSVAMEEEFDKQEPGLPGAMNRAVLRQTHYKLLARSSRWEGLDAPSAAQLRVMEQIIDARLQVQYAQKMEEIEENAQARTGRVLAVRSAAPQGFHQSVIYAALVDQEGRTRLIRAVACLASLLTVLLSMLATLALTYTVTHRACATNSQCQGGGGLSYCSPVDGTCQFCATAAVPEETGATDAVGFCSGATGSHPACAACAVGDKFGQWNLVVLPSGRGSGLSTGIAATFNSTWGTATGSHVVSDRLEAMRFADLAAFVFSAAVIAGILGAHIRDVKLCELKLRRHERELRGKDGRVSEKWRGPLWLSCTVRQYALLPAVASSLPLLLVSGAAGRPHSSADAPAVCLHTITLCFALLALDYIALEYALPMSARIAAEEDFARSRTTNAINSFTGDSTVQGSGSRFRRLLAVSEEEADRLTTNEMSIVFTVGVQFLAMLLPVLVARAEADRSGSSFSGQGTAGHADSVSLILAVGAPFLGSLLCSVLEGAALGNRKLGTSSRLWGVATEIGKWSVGLLIFVLLDMVLLS